MELKKTHPTFVRKDMRGSWSATSTYEMADNRRLRIATLKNYSGAIVTNATVHLLKDGFETHLMYRDFHRNVFNSRTRCTAKAVEAQHAEALKGAAKLMEDAVDHYKTEETSHG